MKILVPVKQVASLREGFALDGDGSLGVDSLDWGPNPWDGCSLEAALQLREGEDGEVVLVTVGDRWAEPALRAGLAMGADRAIRAWDHALAGGGAAGDDPLAVAAVLAAVARAEEAELIICGAQSADAANAATGVALAGLLDFAHVAVVDAIERDGAGLIVQRELEGGAIELLRLTPPALLTVQTGINQPRRPNLRAIKDARARPLAVLELAEVGLDTDALAASAGSRRVALRERPQRAGATVLQGSPSQIAARIAELVGEAMRE